MELKCNSCGMNLIGEDDFVRFGCPKCNEVEIVRCRKCRRKKNTYRCKECGFEGP